MLIAKSTKTTLNFRINQGITLPPACWLITCLYYNILVYRASITNRRIHLSPVVSHLYLGVKLLLKSYRVPDRIKEFLYVIKGNLVTIAI